MYKVRARAHSRVCVRVCVRCPHVDKSSYLYSVHLLLPPLFIVLAHPIHRGALAAVIDYPKGITRGSPSIPQNKAQQGVKPGNK